MVVGPAQDAADAGTGVLDGLAAGRPAFGVGVRHARTADLARMARGAGYDVLWIDLEHSAMPIDAAAGIAATATDLGLEAWVRVPERDCGSIGRLLDGGASGIIMPRVETPEEARRVVDAARFPPRGQRSQLALLPQNGFRRLPAAELMRRADGATSVHILLESAAGIAQADAIAALDGVDILHVGLNDLSVDLGHVGNVRHKDLTECCARVAVAASRHGKLAAVGGVAGPDHYRELLAAGMAPLILAAIDTDILATGLAQRAQDWRQQLAERS